MVTDDNCTSGSAINTDVLQIIVDTGITAYTGITNVGEAWMSLFTGITSDSVIGIKVSLLNPLVATKPETAQAVINGLLQMPITGGFDPNNIIIWDRTNYDLINAGYTMNTGTTGVRCFGTNQSGVGYSLPALNVNGITSYTSVIFSQYIDYLINLPVIKDHSFSGATLTLKSHYGSISNPGSLHYSYCDPYIPALNRELIDALGDKQKFCLVDSIFGIFSGGPNGPPDFAYNGVILGEDMVSIDHIGLDILVENGMNHAWQATHIETASQPPYNLGNYNPSLIERIDIQNPSAGVSNPGAGEPADFRLIDSCPNPFNQSAFIRFSLSKPGRVNLTIYDVRGRLVKVVADGNFSPGQHTLRWNGVDASGIPLPSGAYFCRMVSGDVARSLKMMLVR